MLLTIDIGNTSINFGVFKARVLIKNFSIPTRGYALRDLKKLLAGTAIDECIICSVAPPALSRLKSDLRRVLRIRPYCLGEDIKVPLKNLYRRPRQVGSDRLVNAFAGIQLYGAPLVVIDFGTAVTFDAISKRKEYLGGLILPGLDISLDALAERTALLPRVKLNKPGEFIGRDTKESILSGVVYGFAALSDDLVDRLKSRIGKGAKVIGTGGNIELIKPYCRKIDKIDRDLTLKGLNLLYCYTKLH
ncbi:type III pantothenate kinase [Candidatus Omnitrophota bacterium]